MLETVYGGDKADSDVDDLKLLTIYGWWWLNFDAREIFLMWVPGANVKILDLGD